MRQIRHVRKSTIIHSENHTVVTVTAGIITVQEACD
jgi:hypothetical protein